MYTIVGKYLVFSAVCIIEFCFYSKNPILLLQENVDPSHCEGLEWHTFKITDV